MLVCSCCGEVWLVLSAARRLVSCCEQTDVPTLREVQRREWVVPHVRPFNLQELRLTRCLPKHETCINIRQRLRARPGHVTARLDEDLLLAGVGY